MLRSVRSIWRLNWIMLVLAKHKALFFLKHFPWYVRLVGMFYRLLFCWKFTSKSEGVCLMHALYALGPIYVKVGQAMAVRADIVGDEIAAELMALQDKLPSFSFDYVKKVIARDFGAPLEDIFPEFEEEPVAAASISQVHFAKDCEGNEVAVKVLRPHIERKFFKDIDLFYDLARWANGATAALQRLRLVDVVDNFSHTVRFEVDLRMEAAAASELAENTKKDRGFHMPKIDWDYTSKNVLTMERMRGIRIDHVEELEAAGFDVDDVLDKASRLFFYQVFRDGFFHADMHPGNLMVSETGEIIALDFGIMGRVDLQSRIFLAQILVGFLTRDYKKVADVHFDAGYVPADQSRDDFAQACRSIGEPILGKAQKDISFATLLGQLLKISKQFNMQTQTQLILLQKTMIYAEGLARKLNPDVNFWEISRPLVEEWGKKHLGVEGEIKRVACEVKQLAGRLNGLVKTADYLGEIITPEGIKLHPETIIGLRKRKSRPYLTGFFAGLTIISFFVLFHVVNSAY